GDEARAEVGNVPAAGGFVKARRLALGLKDDCLACDRILQWRAPRPPLHHCKRSPKVSLKRCSTRDLALRTAAGVTPISAATSTGEWPSITVRQNICQVRSSNSPRTWSRAR